MPVLKKHALEAEVKDACELLDRLLVSEGTSAPVNSYFLAHAQGLIFQWSLSAGMGLGLRAGRGFAMAKVDGGWTAPCFISVGSVSVGAIAGVEKVSTLMVASSPDCCQRLSQGMHPVLGTDLRHASFPLHPLPEAELSAAFTGADVHQISYGQGLAVNFSLEGGVMGVDDERNQAMFGAGTTARTTLSGLDRVPAELAPLLAKIEEIIAAGKPQSV